MIGALFLAVTAPAAPAASPARAEVPVIGCPSDGQQGPQPPPPPRPPEPVPRLAPSAAARLAYYVSNELAVFAPHGWRCLALEGSNGSMLVVTPERHSFEDLHDLHGPAVQISLSFGGTSGRFEVAEAIARFFPDHMAFATEVGAEGILDQPLPSGPFPADRIERAGSDVVLFTTPPNARGQGTASLLAANAEAIEGALLLIGSADEPSLIQISVRLPGSNADLAPLVIGEVRRSFAATASDKQD